MGKIISIANHKGGVGKTTTSSSLGVALSMKGKRVLLIDLDSQGNLSSLFVHHEPERTIFEAIKEGKSLPVVQVSDSLDIVPSSKDLVVIEKILTLQYGGSGNAKEYTILRSLLASLRDSYDYILIDCPPSMGDLTINALSASDGVIITMTPESFPTKGLDDLLDAIRRTKTSLNKSLVLSGILITRYNRRKINRIVEESLRRTFGDIVFTTKIRENVDITESPLYCKDIFSYSPNSIGAKDYLELATEVLRKIK